MRRRDVQNTALLRRKMRSTGSHRRCGRGAGAAIAAGPITASDQWLQFGKIAPGHGDCGGGFRRPPDADAMPMMRWYSSQRPAGSGTSASAGRSIIPFVCCRLAGCKVLRRRWLARGSLGIEGQAAVASIPSRPAAAVPIRHAGHPAARSQDGDHGDRLALRDVEDRRGNRVDVGHDLAAD